jgi:hypothetical protein
MPGGDILIGPVRAIARGRAAQLLFGRPCWAAHCAEHHPQCPRRSEARALGPPPAGVGFFILPLPRRRPADARAKRCALGQQLHAGARQGGDDLHPQVALHAPVALLVRHLGHAPGLEAVQCADCYTCRSCKLLSGQ